MSMNRLLPALVPTLVSAIAAMAAGAASNPLPRPADAEIAKIYAGLLDRELDQILPGFDPSAGLLEGAAAEAAAGPRGGETAPDLGERRRLAEEERYRTLHRAVRGSADLAGALAHAYSMPQSKYHQSPEAFQAIRLILKAFEARQNAEGEFVFSPVRFCTVWGPHEMAWRVESLLTAFRLVGDELPAAEGRSARRMLERAIAFLAESPPGGHTYQSMVWGGVMAMAADFTGSAEHAAAAGRGIADGLGLFKENGEVADAIGPDLQHSALAIQYLALYRRAAGERGHEETIEKALLWYSRLYTAGGLPLEGMSANTVTYNGEPLAHLLGAYAEFGERNPVLTQLATRYLEGFIINGQTAAARFGAGHFMAGAVHHGRPERLPAIPNAPYAQLYENPHSVYFAVGREYQTLVTLRGRPRLKGMQAWARRGRYPLIFPAPGQPSRAVGFGYDSALIDADASGYRLTKISDNLDALLVSQGRLITAYLFSRDLTAVAYRDLSDRTLVDWSQNAAFCAPVIDAGNEIRFDGTEARLVPPRIQPELITGGSHPLLRFRFTGEYCWFLFAGPESNAVVQPVTEGVILVQVAEGGERTNFTINMNTEPYEGGRRFPGTAVEIPPMPPLGAAWVEPE